MWLSRPRDAATPAVWQMGFLLLVALVSACSGNVNVNDTGGAGGTGGGAGASGGAGGATSAGGGTIGDGGSGGGAPGLYDTYCEAKASCEPQGPSFDYGLCVASAECDPLLLHHPGGELFECLSAGPCSFDGCLLDLYLDYTSSDYTPAAQEFQDGCVAAIEAGCSIFEDFCLAGALFTDEALTTMTACFDLPTCAETKSCALSTYVPCTNWVYQVDP